LDDTCPLPERIYVESERDRQKDKRGEETTPLPTCRTVQRELLRRDIVDQKATYRERKRTKKQEMIAS
jgi:hypothetical protein